MSTINLHQLLKAVIDQGASDLHITAGSAPQLRINGSLIPLKTPPLTAVQSKQLCYSILNEKQKHRFEEELELDMSFGVKGLARFRANVYTQKGAVAGASLVYPTNTLLIGNQNQDDFGKINRIRFMSSVLPRRQREMRRRTHFKQEAATMTQGYGTRVTM